MRKMLGAVLILLASVYGAYLLLLRQRERRKDILALQSSLLILKRELKERLTPLKECFELLQQREKRENVKAFYQQLVAGMTSLGVKRFSALWHQTVTDTLTFLGSQQTERVCSLGTVLEGADAEPLCEALESVALDLGACARGIEEKQRDNTRLAFGISFSLGALFIIMLI